MLAFFVAFFVEVHSVLAPSVEVGDQFEVLAGPRMKGMGNPKTSIQTACIRRSRRLRPMRPVNPL